MTTTLPSEPAWKGVPDNIVDHVGFVYIIKHVATEKYYVGKKQFWKKIRRKPLKGQKRVRLGVLESDWKSYWGSSVKFLAFAKEHNFEGFERRIVNVYKNKFDLAYSEIKLQMQMGVLFDSNSFNEIVNVRLRKPKP